MALSQTTVQTGRRNRQVSSVEQPQQAVPPGLSGGNDGGGLGVPPGYAEFVTAAG